VVLARGILESGAMWAGRIHSPVVLEVDSGDRAVQATPTPTRLSGRDVSNDTPASWCVPSGIIATPTDCGDLGLRAWRGWRLSWYVVWRYNESNRLGLAFLVFTLQATAVPERS
jgi:hypothetical protein